MLESAKRRRRLARIINQHGAYGTTIVRQAGRAGITVALAAALVEQESGFRNIFGCDLGARSSVPYCNQKVTYRRTRKLVNHVKRGGTSNGVGLTQLTSYDFLRRAGQRLHRPTAQCRVGFQHLKYLIDKHGKRFALGAYNGGEGNPQFDYADEVLAREAKWRKRFRA